ncbi:MAG: FkbM family methyltransferase [Patescibacteria group bacterium]
MNQVYWKWLLGVFKLKRLVKRWYGTRKLDYMKDELHIVTSTVREYVTRANSCSKEPETVAWIESTAADGAVFYDIGANVGAYSLVAAVNGYTVLAFEPAYMNMSSLEDNVTLNDLNKSIACYQLGFSDRTHLETFSFLDSTPGTSQIFQSSMTDYHRSGDVEVKKAALIFSLDDFMALFKPAFPTHIKIDIDGGELALLAGAVKTLAVSRVQHVLLEVEEKDGAVETADAALTKAGFSLSASHRRDKHTVNRIYTRA